MSFDYDVDDDVEVEETAYKEESTEDVFSSEYSGDFEEIDFEALGIDPSSPTAAKPGTEEKVLMLAARYAAGVPLWHGSDCYDHGPGQSVSRLIRKG
jgi:hypothetical protein